MGAYIVLRRRTTHRQAAFAKTQRSYSQPSLAQPRDDTRVDAEIAFMPAPDDAQLTNEALDRPLTALPSMWAPPKPLSSRGAATLWRRPSSRASAAVSAPAPCSLPDDGLPEPELEPAREQDLVGSGRVDGAPPCNPLRPCPLVPDLQADDDQSVDDEDIEAMDLNHRSAARAPAAPTLRMSPRQREDTAQPSAVRSAAAWRAKQPGWRECPSCMRPVRAFWPRCPACHAPFEGGAPVAKASAEASVEKEEKWVRGETGTAKGGNQHAPLSPADSTSSEDISIQLKPSPLPSSSPVVPAASQTPPTPSFISPTGVVSISQLPKSAAMWQQAALLPDFSDIQEDTEKEEEGEER